MIIKTMHIQQLYYFFGFKVNKINLILILLTNTLNKKKVQNYLTFPILPTGIIIWYIPGANFGVLITIWLLLDEIMSPIIPPISIFAIGNGKLIPVIVTNSFPKKNLKLI